MADDDDPVYKSSEKNEILGPTKLHS